MSTSRSTTRAAAAARTRILDELKDDHRRVQKAYRQFRKLDCEQDPAACEAIVQQTLQELQIHAALEEELLYPAARGNVADDALVDEAEVEHESAHTLIAQLLGTSADDPKYSARFVVLCEYVRHHVREEEGELFPQLERARMDWETLAQQMSDRRLELAADPDAASAAPADEAVPAIDDEAPTTGTKSMPRGPDKPAVAATRRTI